MSEYLSILIDPLRDALFFINDQLVSSWAGTWSWAISIIFLTVIVRVLLIPLTVKQYTSMRAMQRLQPKIKELQKKYKDDRQKLNEELMKFYRENQVNPFGSCLPLVLQIPIFMALYFMLTDTSLFETNNAFLWIPDIRAGNYPLIVIYIASQLLSSLLMTTTVDKTQRMLMYAMPLMIGVFFLINPFPAGVLIYWVTTNFWTIGQQLVVKKIITAREGELEPVVVAEPAPAKKTGGKHGGTPKSRKKRR